jgi:hypothetical protein
MLRSRLAVLLGWAVGTLCFGCGGDAREASRPGPSTAPCPAGYVTDGAGNCVPAATPAPTSAESTGPAGPAGPGPAPTAGVSGSACVPLDPTAAAAATQLIAPLGASHAPAGAQPVGALVAGQCTTGQSLEADVPVQPGRCYTVVGAALAPVQDLDLQLSAPLGVTGLGSPVLAEDKSDGPTAVLGESPHCFKWAWPQAATMKLVVRVQAGQGVVAAQVYAK